MDKSQLKYLSKPEKIAATHSLTSLGFSLRKISEILGIDENTVMSYQKKELDEEFKQFSEAIKKIWLQQDAELLAMVLKELKEKLPKARYYELIGLYKTIRDANREPTQIVNQIGIKGDKPKVVFVSYDENHSPQGSNGGGASSP